MSTRVCDTVAATDYKSPPQAQHNLAHGQLPVFCRAAPRHCAALTLKPLRPKQLTVFPGRAGDPIMVGESIELRCSRP